MSISYRKPEWSRYAVTTCALLMLGIAGDIHAFAGEAPPPVPAATAEESKPHLLTREEMLKGVIEAEQKRSFEARPDEAIDNRTMREKWGVEVISVSYAADGFWLNFRFRVVDAEKAGILFDSKLKPYLEAEASGVKMAVPSAAKVGALRTTDRGRNIKPNKIYNMMFANPAFHVKPGQRVTVVVGDFREEHMKVRGVRDNLSVKSVSAKGAAAGK